MTDEDKKKQIEEMTADILKGLDEAHATLNAAHKDGTVPDPIYHKYLVMLAHQYFLEGQHLRALGIIHSIPAKYFEEHQLKQMLEDAQYFFAAQELAMKLVEGGHADYGAPIRPTQAPAQA